MAELADARPVFHSEADFQHALAWQIHKTIPESQVRPEFNPFPADDRQIYLDIWVPTEGIALELKYFTRSLLTVHEDEFFFLRNQAAEDLGRYDFLKDIQRLEDFLRRREDAEAGFSVLLTNNQGYWNGPRDGNTIDAAFRLYEGRTITGELAWSARASRGTTKSREDPICISNSYNVRWRDYSTLERLSPQDSRLVVKGKEQFRYLVVEVSQPALVADS